MEKLRNSLEHSFSYIYDANVSDLKTKEINDECIVKFIYDTFNVYIEKIMFLMVDEFKFDFDFDSPKDTIDNGSTFELTNILFKDHRVLINKIMLDLIYEYDDFNYELKNQNQDSKINKFDEIKDKILLNGVKEALFEAEKYLCRLISIEKTSLINRKYSYVLYGRSTKKQL